MKKTGLCIIVLVLLFTAFTAFAAVKYVKVASFKDIGQNRAFFIAMKEEVSPDALEDDLWEIVNYYMDKYGQAPQMWIYFFDDKKYAPKQFPIEGEALKHLIATYFYATDTRKKDLQVLTGDKREEMLKSGAIKSPLWEGQ